jgi:hypothetical protein
MVIIAQIFPEALRDPGPITASAFEGISLAFLKGHQFISCRIVNSMFYDVVIAVNRIYKRLTGRELNTLAISEFIVLNFIRVVIIEVKLL